MSTEWKNDKPFEHTSANGTTFRADRGDMSTGVKVSNMWHITEEKMHADFMEFGAWHAMWIHPFLNGFQGYDTVVYDFEEMPE